ncbi:MAG: GNAT family N-acetyltransferase [Firmicutes bacterium]|nr:GNAT family N-acetyltransferase [Bacillota bacterium]
MTYESERLTFRPWTMDDAEECFQLSSDELVGPMCGWMPHKTIDETIDILENVLINDHTFCIIEKSTGKIIGNMGIDFVHRVDEKGNIVHVEDQRELGFWLGQPHWNKGFMTEAVKATIDYCFDELGMTELKCGHFDDNHASARVQEKCGFKYEKTAERYWERLQKNVVLIDNYLTKDMRQKRKPMIGVQALVDEKRDSYWMLPGYFDGITEAGGIPIMLPLTSDEDEIKQLVNTFDGFIFTGGHDVGPEVYGMTDETGNVEPCKDRDDMEVILLREIMKVDKPVLGICRGLQFINAALGGDLYQDIPMRFPSDVNHRQPAPYDEPIHSVKLEEGSWLASITGEEEIMVNSCHHQGIKNLAECLSVSAKADDGLVEAVEMPGKKYLKAVQWHPEFMHKKDAISREIFKDFVDACR